jgi:hypothetical protein
MPSRAGRDFPAAAFRADHALANGRHESVVGDLIDPDIGAVPTFGVEAGRGQKMHTVQPHVAERIAGPGRIGGRVMGPSSSARGSIGNADDDGQHMVEGDKRGRIEGADHRAAFGAKDRRDLVDHDLGGQF